MSPVVKGDWYRPSPFTTWQWQLKGEINTLYPVQIYDVDLFDTSESLVQQLHASGKKVICYFSAGSFENWRPDVEKFKSGDKGNTLDGWPDEQWLDIRSSNVHEIMKRRLDLARQKGCDGVEPDNMDAYVNDSGCNLSASDQLAYNRFIANEAHRRGLSVGLKNDLAQVRELEPYYDFTVNEQCFEYEECYLLKPFIDAGKPVLNAEYNEEYVTNTTSRQTLCQESIASQFSTLILPLELNDDFRFSCL